MAFEGLIRWLWPEGRSALAGGSSHIDSEISYYDTFYGDGDQANVFQTYPVEFALGMVGRAFMLAEVTPKLATLSPLMLSMIARQTLLGNSVWEVAFDREIGEPVLLPIAEYEVRGGMLPRSWRYQIEQELPAGDRLRRNLPWNGVVHVRYMPRPSAPWHGVSPLVAAGLTSKQLARIERSLAYEAEPPSGIMLPLPDGMSSRQTTAVNTALTTGRGGVTPIETTAGGFGQGQQAAPRQDWQQKRYGPEVPATSIQMRDTTGEAVMSVLGMPPGLYNAAGGAQRESNRHFYTVTAEPLGVLIQDELSLKLEREVTITFPAATRSDISARSRAFASLIQAGLTHEAAAKQAGLLPISLSDVKVEPQADSEPPDDETPTPPGSTNGSMPNARIYTAF